MADDFKVVIVGGSVAGLSLAHCLERLGVSYVVLEKGNQIAPQLGASIGILPNGGRILDQLGIFGDVEDEIEPLNFAVIRYADGFSFRSQYPKALHSSYGYPVSFLERQKFIQILHDKLRGKNHVHTRKRVVSIVDGPGKALIRTSDGDEYDADMVVGADGVHSVVRSEIWRHTKEAAGAAVTEEEPNVDIKYDYACVYGISVNVPHAEIGVQLSSLSDGVSIHLFAGKGSKFFWFVMMRTSRDEFLELKKDSARMARRTCEGLGSKRLSDAVYFRDVWSRCTVYQMTPLEEGVFRQWNRGRLVCIGDAIRKMAPNIGQGANMAIEDAAQLSNLIREMLASPRNASATTVEKMLRDFVATQKARTKSMCGQSEFLVRMHANEGFGRRLLGRYLFPSLQDAPAGLAGLSIRGAVKLECAGVPSRTLGKAWEGSWGSSLRNLMYLRPRLGILSLVYVVAGLVMMYMSIYLVVPVRLAAQASTES